MLANFIFLFGRSKLPFKVCIAAVAFLASAGFTSAWSTPQSLITYPQDHRAFKAVQLSNGLRVLLIADEKAERAAAALDVFVGSGEDPAEAQGLAHFLEHMLFLGTHKYPEAGEFQAFVAGHGGSHNAYTSLTHTNYHFDIDPASFEPALDRFAQFFISPLFSKRFIARERRVVHSEYASKLTQESRRERDVIRELVVAGHPISKFSTGNEHTLSGVDAAALKAFFAQHYRASRMALVVAGPFSIEQMQRWVETRFAAISAAAPAVIKERDDLFQKDFLPAEIHIRPKKDRRKLSLLFPVPDSRLFVEKKPLHYVGNLLGHEGEGSLLNALKSRGWATALSAGRFVNWRGGETFGVKISLTESGFENVAMVNRLVFDFIDKIGRQGIEAWRYAELAQLSRLAFNFRQTGDSVRELARLASRMHWTPIERIFWDSYRFDIFDEALIRDYLNYLNRDNALALIVSPDVSTREVSQYYETPYKIAKKTESLLTYKESLPYARLKKTLALPKPNTFIAQNTDIIEQSVEGKKMDLPRAIVREENLNGWYLNDNIQDVPKGAVYARYLLPNVALSPKAFAALRVYTRMLRDELNSTSYSASLAGLSYSLSANTRGIDLVFHGYSDSLDELSEMVLTAMRKLNRSHRYRKRLTETYFAHAKSELIRIQKNKQHDKIYSQALREIPAALYSPYWSKDDLIAALTSLSVKEFLTMSKIFFDGAVVDALVFGNFDEGFARRQFASLGRIVRERGDTMLAPGKVVNLSKSAPFAHALEVDSEENVSLVYIQGRNDSLEERAKLMVLDKALSSPFYHRLRTEKQLGYIVMSANYTLRDVPGLVAVVQSPTHTPDTLYRAMREFFLDYKDEVLTHFERDKSAVISELRDTPDSQSEWGRFFWQSILNKDYDFDQQDRMIAAVEAMTRQDIHALYQQLFVDAQADFVVVAARGVAQVREIDPSVVAFDDYKLFKRSMPAYIYP